MTPICHGCQSVTRAHTEALEQQIRDMHAAAEAMQFELAAKGAEVERLRRFERAYIKAQEALDAVEALDAEWLGILDGSVESWRIDFPTLAHCQAALRAALTPRVRP